MALRAFLVGVGMRKGEATEAAARVVQEAYEAAQWASLRRARETAAQLEGLGLHLPELLGGANAVRDSSVRSVRCRGATSVDCTVCTPKTLQAKRRWRRSTGASARRWRSADARKG